MQILVAVWVVIVAIDALPLQDGLRRFREMEYVDGIRVDANAGAWDAFARYAAGQVAHPSGRRSAVRQVSLRRYWATIPPPSSGILPSGPYLYFTGSSTYHVWTPPGSGG